MDYLSCCKKMNMGYKELESFKFYIKMAHKLGNNRVDGYNWFLNEIDELRRGVVETGDSIAIKTAVLGIDKIVKSYINKKTMNHNFYVDKCIKGEESWCRVENRYLICGKNNMTICSGCEYLNTKNSKAIIECDECSNSFKTTIRSINLRNSMGVPNLCTPCVVRRNWVKRMYINKKQTCPTCGVPIMPTSKHCSKCTPYRFVINISGKKR